MAKLQIKLPCPNEVYLEKYYELAKDRVDVHFENNEVTITQKDNNYTTVQHIEARYKCGTLFAY